MQNKISPMLQRVCEISERVERQERLDDFFCLLFWGGTLLACSEMVNVVLGILKTRGML